MANQFTWNKETLKRRTFSISQNGETKASILRRNMFSAEAEAEAGKNRFLFKPDGRFDRQIDIYDAKSEAKLGRLSFRWIDFQKSYLELENGTRYAWRSHEVLKGAWAWYEVDKPTPLMTFQVDNPFHRSGEIEMSSAKISAADRDMLLTLGLQLQLYINTWMIITTIIVIGVVTG